MHVEPFQLCLFLSHLGTVQVSGCWFRSAELQTTQSFQCTNPKDRNILYAIEPWGQFYRLCIFGVPVLCSFYQRYDVFSAQMYVICTTHSLSLSLTHTHQRRVCMCVCVCVGGGSSEHQHQQQNLLHEQLQSTTAIHGRHPTFAFFQKNCHTTQKIPVQPSRGGVSAPGTFTTTSGTGRHDYKVGGGENTPTFSSCSALQDFFDVSWVYNV